MTTDRKAILLFLGVCVVALGGVFLYRLKTENAHLRQVIAAQEWASRSVAGEARSSPAPTEPGPEYEPECVHDYDQTANLRFKDGSEFCLTWERDLYVLSLQDMHEPRRMTHVFSLIQPDGTKKEITRRVEGYHYKGDGEHVEIPGVPKASLWYPLGISEDEERVYFTRSQGLPIDGFSTGNRLDLWSLDIASGDLEQVYKAGDIWNYQRSPYIVDAHTGSERILIRELVLPRDGGMGDVKLVGFDGKTILRLPEPPFDLKKPEGLMDFEEYTFSEDGKQILVTASREEPFGSSNVKDYGPAVFDIATKRFLP